MSKIYYKYRSLNYQFLTDILVNQRLYASKYDRLNDPMEGHFNYYGGSSLLKILTDEKQNKFICSLSETKNNMLMWSHYCNGHNGIVIGATTPEDAPHKVNYSNKLPKISSDPRDIEHSLTKILTTKLDYWKYEEEYRVITSKEYVNIAIKEIIFGARMEEKDKNLIKKITDKFNNNVDYDTVNLDT